MNDEILETNRLNRFNIAYPDTLHVEIHSISGYPFVVGGLEKVAWGIAVDETFPQVLHLQLEFVRRQDLVRQRGECKVEVVR